MTNLPLYNGDNAVITCIEGLLGYVRLIPCFMGEGECAEHVEQLFFDSVVRVFGLPDEVLHDRDPRFTANFWRHLWDTLGSRAVFLLHTIPRLIAKQSVPIVLLNKPSGACWLSVANHLRLGAGLLGHLNWG